MSSPGLYARKSVNTIPLPTRRERCAPFSWPCAGRRSASDSVSSLCRKLWSSKGPVVAKLRGPLCKTCRRTGQPLAGGRPHPAQDVFENEVGIDPLGFCVEVEQQSVTQRVHGHSADVFGRYVQAVVDQCVHLGA